MRIFNKLESLVFYFILSILFIPNIIYCGVVKWQTNGVVICNSSGSQYYPRLCPDGTGGAYIVWRDGRSGSSEIYCQRIDADGNIKWQVNGVKVGNSTNSTFYPNICPDTSGGAIIVWSSQDDYYSPTSYNVYVQRVDSNGTAKWTANGVVICSATGAVLRDSSEGLAWSPNLWSDGTGGAVITWGDESGSNYRIFVQKVDSNGTAKWTTNGVSVCSDTDMHMGPIVSIDGTGGAIIAWYNGSLPYTTLAQRVDSNGSTKWTTNGKTIGPGKYTKICSDGADGAIIGYTYPGPNDDPAGDWNDYAHRVDKDGNFKWATGNYANTVCKAAGEQERFHVAPDGTGGAVFSWQDARSGRFNVYCQRIDANGTVKWTTDGVAVRSNSKNAQTHGGGNTRCCLDGTGGVIVTWRGNSNDKDKGDVYAQRVDVNGNVKWTTNGEPIRKSTAPSWSWDSQICPDGLGGAYIAWEDDRSGSFDIYCQRVNDKNTSGVKFITNTAGGVAIGDDGKTKITIPANALGTDMGILISTNPLSNPITATTADVQTANGKVNYHRLIGVIREFKAYNATTGQEVTTDFTSSVTMEIPYTDTDGDEVVDGTDVLADNLVVYVLNETTKQWEKVATSSVSKGSRCITATVKHFSVYTIMETDSNLVLRDVKVYPNPYKPNSGLGHNKITFAGLPLTATIRVYNVSGELVSTLDETDGDGKYEWLGTNDNGDKLASGIYVYVITNESGIKRGKLAIIK